MFRANPSPDGRRRLEEPDEGYNIRNCCGTPHPPLRGTLSRRERDFYSIPIPK
jgi:hypothetical protein